MLFYNYFYRQFGVRKTDQLINPVIIPINRLEFPKNSILHYMGSDSINDVGPNPNDPLFKNITKPIFVCHKTGIGDTLGNPHKIPMNWDSVISKFHSHNRRFRIMRDEASVVDIKDMLSLVVYSYCLIPRAWRYTRSLYSDYHRWHNFNAAIWKTAGSVASVSDRHQFILLDLPTRLPTVTDLTQAENNGINQKTIGIFTTPESRVLLEIWKWLGERKTESLLANIPDGKTSLINLIFVDNGKWLMINLGILASWRNATSSEIKNWKKDNPNENLSKSGLIQDGIEATRLQRRFLRLVLAGVAARNLDGEELFDEEFDPESDLMQQQFDDPAQVIDTGTGEIKAGATQAVKPQLTKLSDKPLDQVSEKIKTANVVLKPELSKTVIEKPVSELSEKEIDDRTDSDLEQLDRIAQKLDARNAENAEKIDLYQRNVTVNPEDGIREACDELAESGRISAAEYKRYTKLGSAYRSIKAPNGKDTLEKFVQITPEELNVTNTVVVPDSPTIIDKTMLNSSIRSFDEHYVKNVLEKDIASSVLNLQNAGIAVTSYEVEEVTSILGDFKNYAVQIAPVDGKPSTLKFTLPTVKDDGTFVANGIKYRLRKQTGDIPIRKTGPNEVALTSYYGKTFVSRSEKKVHDYFSWLSNKIREAGFDPADDRVVQFYPGNVFDPAIKAPRLYTALSMNFIGFNAKGYSFHFNYSKREEEIGLYAIEAFEKKGLLVFGVENAKKLSNQLNYIAVDANNTIYLCSGASTVPQGTFESFLGFDTTRAPIDFAEVKVMGKQIPVGVILAHEIGLGNLIKSLDVPYRRVLAGKRVNQEPHEYSIVFEDETLVFDRQDRIASLILGGFNEYRDALKLYSVYDFDKPDVYLNIIESRKLTSRYLREIKLMYQLFIDPITKDILIKMNEPTTFRGLLMRSCELLMTDDHPREIDPDFMRKKGYERFAGMAYSEIIKAVRMQRGRVDRSRAPIELNPISVWMSIGKDPSKILISDINPIQNLKEMEAVTFGGTGGRSTRSMVKRTREYHRNDMGVISESTSDSSDTGVNSYTSANPQFTTVRGDSRKYDFKQMGAAALLSTSAVLAPCADRDDPKRTNFVAIQNGHTVSCEGYEMPMVRTGYEQVIAHRTSDLFAASVKKPGRVKSISERGIVIEYDDGESLSVELGRRFGKASGLTIPHEVKTDLKVGQKVKPGDIAAYNTGFFKKDYLNPSGVSMSMSMMATVVLLESAKTLDDSSAITEKLAERLKTKVSYVRSIVVNFRDSVEKLVKPGDVLNSESILCYIQDETTASSGAFDDETIDTLRMLSAQAPQAKHKGVVEKIEVYYHGEKEDMSKSLRSYANASDRDIAERMKSLDQKAMTGSVDNNFRIEGNPLLPDTLVIQVYITDVVAAGIGDKGVFANQLKTVFCDVMKTPYVTESGIEIDAVFGNKSVFNRIVNSPYLIGTTSTLLKIIGKKAVSKYRGA